MRRNLYLVLVAALASAVLAAGCGGDDNGGGGGSSSSSKSSDTSTSSSSSSNPDVQRIIDSCKQSVSSAQGLSAAAKKDLDDLCEKAGSGDEEAARKASQDVCVRIVKDTIPSGPAQDQGVNACKQSQ